MKTSKIKEEHKKKKEQKKEERLNLRETQATKEKESEELYEMWLERKVGKSHFSREKGRKLPLF